jgi:predicted ATP-grasp superfamily ATP-dependent carboligase
MERWYLSPTLSEGFEKYFRFLETLEAPGVIIPSGDLSVKFLTRYARPLKDAGFLFNVPSVKNLEILFDKLNCNRACISSGIPVARTWSISELDQEPEIIKTIRWPVIVKPTALAGGNYLKVNTPERLPEAIRNISQLASADAVKLNESTVVVQEWIDSGMTDNWSCDVFVRSNGELADHVTIQRVRTSLNEKGTPTSRMYCGKLTPQPLLLERVKILLKAYEWRGFAHVEFIYSERDNEFYLTEVNPRLPGYAFLLSSSGHEQGWFYVADLIGQRTENKGKDKGVIYFEALRYPGDLTDGFVNSLRGYLSIGKLLTSYWAALWSDDQVVVDYFNSKDPGLTIGLFISNMRRFFKKIVGYIKRRLIKNGFQ